MSDESENKPAIIKKKTHKNKVNKKRPKKSGLLKKPKIVSNRFIFRDQLTANKYDLVGEILKNIALLPDPESRLNFQLQLLPFAYHALDVVETLQAIDPSRENGNDNKNDNAIDAEFTDTKEPNKFDAIMRRI